MFQTQTGPMWDKLIPAQSTSSTSFAHALARWGVRLLGMETAAVQPMFAMRIAFTRGAARQYGGAFLYYHAPNFGDTATTFTNAQNFAGPNNFFHSRYGATMGPSLSWYRKSYYLYYMAGASAIYLEQGFDQFFKPGPGEHPFQLNPLGRITDEFMRFAEKHPDRGTPYTPVAFLLDPAHGFEMTDYPHWPFGVSQISRSDRALRELFGVAYYPGLVVEGEPATSDRQVFVNGIFGDIFDVTRRFRRSKVRTSNVQSLRRLRLSPVSAVPTVSVPRRRRRWPHRLVSGMGYEAHRLRPQWRYCRSQRRTDQRSSRTTSRRSPDRHNRRSRHRPLPLPWRATARLIRSTFPLHQARTQGSNYPHRHARAATHSSPLTNSGREASSFPPYRIYSAPTSASHHLLPTCSRMFSQTPLR